MCFRLPKIQLKFKQRQECESNLTYLRMYAVFASHNLANCWLWVRDFHFPTSWSNYFDQSLFITVLGNQ